MSPSPSVNKLHTFGSDRGLTPGQVALGWVLAKQPALVPIVGARTRAQLDDALATLDKPLSPADVAALERLVPADAVGGTRYSVEHMGHLDSER